MTTMNTPNGRQRRFSCLQVMLTLAKVQYQLKKLYTEWCAKCERQDQTKCMPGKSYCRRLRSLLLYLCYVFQVLPNTPVWWLWKAIFNWAQRQSDKKTKNKSSIFSRKHEICDINSFLRNLHRAQSRYSLLIIYWKPNLKKYHAWWRQNITEKKTTERLG